MCFDEKGMAPSPTTTLNNDSLRSIVPKSWLSSALGLSKREVSKVLRLMGSRSFICFLVFDHDYCEDLTVVLSDGEKQYFLDLSEGEYTGAVQHKTKLNGYPSDTGRYSLHSYLSIFLAVMAFGDRTIPFELEDEVDVGSLGKFLTNFRQKFEHQELTYHQASDIELASFAGTIGEISDNPNYYIRVELHPTLVGATSTSSKPIGKSRSTKGEPTKHGEYITLSGLELWSDMNWLQRSAALRVLMWEEEGLSSEEKLTLEKLGKELEEEFALVLQELQLVDGYAPDNTPRLQEMTESLVDDLLAGRPSNKLLMGPQGTGKTTFAKLIARLMNARLITIECGPVTDNQDLIGGYEIQVDPETRQAVTVFHENGLLYACRLVSEGERVVVAFEEYNLLPSEALLKQLNRAFQERILATLGGRHEVDISNRKNDLVVLLLGNHIPGQEWLEDVGLMRRFDFFELGLPSTEAVVQALWDFVISPSSPQRLTLEGAERIGEIRDDLVAALDEKTIRPLLSRETRYPDLYTLRNFAMDLVHGVSVVQATERHLVKIILGGRPIDNDLREEYDEYSSIIHQTVEDRLPEKVFERC